MNTKIVFLARHHQLLWLIFSLLGPLPLFGADIPSTHRDALQGTWQAVSVADGGTPEYGDRVSTLQLKIKDDEYTYDFGDHRFGATFSIDPTKQPKEMDVRFWEGPQTGKVMKAIYDLEGDRLKICTAPYTRPAKFESTLESQSILFEFQRDLPSKNITSAEILDYGLYTGKPVTTIPGRTTDGSSLEIITAQLIEQTQIVPDKLDTEFGVHFMVHGSPKGKQVKLCEVILSPPTTDAKTGKTTTQTDIPITVGLEESKDTGIYCLFNSPSDLVPGTWTFQLFDHGKLLLQKVFTVVKP